MFIRTRIFKKSSIKTLKTLFTTFHSYKISTGTIMSKPVVFMNRDDIPEVAKKLLQQKFQLKTWPVNKPLTREIMKEQIAGVYGIFIWGHLKMDGEIVKAAGKNLKVISTMSVGYDHIEVSTLKAAGIRIGNTPDVLTEATAEMAMALLLATSRRVFESSLIVQKNEWMNGAGPLWMCGQGLEGSTVGIVGFGRIGCSVAVKSKAFCCKRLLYSSRQEKPEAAVLGGELKSLDEIMKESDFIVVTLALNDNTKGIINRERINLMKPNAIFVNVARGGVVDQAALTEALQNKKIAGAGLDVFVTEPIERSDPLLKLDNVVMTPHIGSATIRARYAMAEMAAKNILAVLEGKEMLAEIHS